MKLSVLVLLAVAAFGPSNVFGELKMVAFVFRHGARTPASPYPNDIYANFNWDGLSAGALTSTGVKEMFQHGSRLGNTYKSLLAKEGLFRNYNLQAKSSSVERSLMSGLSFLAGFYPSNQNLNQLSIKWQPVPIFTIPEEEDYYIQGIACTKMIMQFYQRVTAPNEDFKRLMTNDQEMISVFEANTGQKNMTIMQIFSIFDTLKVQSEWNLAPPTWFKPSYWDRFDDYTEAFMNSFTATQELKNLRGGPLITEILDSMTAATTNSVYKKVFLYSGHDATVSAVARALHIESQVSRVFEYGATFALELHKTGNIDEIKIKFYASAESTQPQSVNIPNCPQPCSLQNFKNLYANLVIRNIAELCKV